MPAGAYTFQVGSFRCSVLTDGYFSYPASWFFPNADPIELARALDAWRLPHDQVLSPYACLLIETGRCVVLVDTGSGGGLTTSGAIGARLELMGIRPRDVDTVILTHAHPDHIGGAVDAKGRPAFPHARFVISEAECDFWSRARPDLNETRLPADVRAAMAETARRCLTILRHQLEPVAGEAEILPGMRVIPAPGHTPGHLAVAMDIEGRRFLNLGDAAVHPLHLENPEWHNGFDHDPRRAVSTRKLLLDRAAREEMSVMAFHFPFPSVGRITPRPEGGWNWKPG